MASFENFRDELLRITICYKWLYCVTEKSFKELSFEVFKAIRKNTENFLLLKFPNVQYP